MTLAEVDWAGLKDFATWAIPFAFAAYFAAKARANAKQRDVLSEGIEAANGGAAPVRAALSERLRDDPATKAALETVREKSTAKLRREQGGEA